MDVRSLTQLYFFPTGPLTSREFVKVFTSKLKLPAHCLLTCCWLPDESLGKEHRATHRGKAQSLLPIQGVLPPWTGATVLPAATRTRSCSSPSGRPARPCCKSSRPRRSAGVVR